MNLHRSESNLFTSLPIHAIAVAVAVMLAACGGGADDQARQQTTAQGGKKYGGTFSSNVLRGNPKGLDPVLISSKHADDIASQVFDRLVELNEKLELIPELARELPTISADGRIYTFKLRTDVNFHDDSCFPGAKGRRMTAEDVRYSFTRCCDPRTSTVAFWAFKDKVKGATEYYNAVLAMTANPAPATSQASKATSATPKASKGSTTTPATSQAPKATSATPKVSKGSTTTPATSETPKGSTTTPATAPEPAVAASHNPPPIEGFKVIDDSTFQIELVEPYTPFLYYLVNSLGDVVPREAVEAYKEDFFRHPVGTGPFVFASWVPDRDLVLRRNPKYWGRDADGNQLPFLDELRFLFIKDDKVQFNEFMMGNLNEVFGIPTELFPSVLDSTRHLLPEYSRYTLQTSPAMLTWYFEFHNQKPPFNKADVRRAFNYAIDREKIVRFVLQNSPYAAAVHGLVPPVFNGYPVESIKGYDYNPTEAKRLMAQAGYPDGKGFPAITLHVYPEPRLGQVAQAVQEMLRTALNVQVDIKVLEFPQLLDQAQLGQLDFWGTRWYGDYPDPETYLVLLNGDLVPDQPGLPSYPNSSRYNSDAFNALFHKGISTIDHVAQMKHYADAEQTAMADAPIMPLFYEMHYRLLQPSVRDYPLDAMARIDLKYAWLDGP